MKKKILIVLTAATMMLSSANAFAATKNYARNSCSNSSFDSLLSNYLGDYKLNFNSSNCISNSNLSDFLNCYYGTNCDDIWSCLIGGSNNCGTGNNQNNPDCGNTDKPGINNPGTDEPDTDKPDTEKPDTDKPGGNQGNTDSDQNISESQFAAEVVRLVNIERSKEGLSALKSDSTVQSAAQVRAKEIVSSFSHTRPDGSQCFTALQEAGVNYSGAGENIAYGQKTPQEVVTAWMNSPGHRANIMNGSFTTIGVGCYKSGNTYYWSQFFTY